MLKYKRGLFWAQYCLMSSLMSWTTEYMPSKFPGDTELRRMADIPEGLAAIQKDLNRMEEQENLTELKKDKFKVLHLGMNNPRHR